MWRPRIRDLPPPCLPLEKHPHPEPCWREGRGRQGVEVGELPEGWSRDVILVLFPSSCAARTLIIVITVALEP